MGSVMVEPITIKGESDSIDFLPVLKHGDSYAACLDEGVRFGGFPFRGQVRFIGCRQCSSYLVSTGV